MSSGRLTKVFSAAPRGAGLAVACAVLAVGQPAHAGSVLRICTDDASHPPFLYPDRDGTVQVLVRMASAQVGMPVAFVPMPVRRCKAELQRRAMDAAIAAAPVQANAGEYAYPVRRGRADPDQAVAVVQSKVFRRKGSHASWDGNRFSELSGPVLVPTGNAFITHRLVQLEVPFDEGGRNAEQNFMKLLASRADLVIVPENDGMALLRDPRWAAKIEALPAPFTSQEFFLAFSQGYFREQPALATAFWRAIGEIRNSREYRDAIASQR
jgi:polar amino acid transport system substrate-binding protein